MSRLLLAIVLSLASFAAMTPVHAGHGHHHHGGGYGGGYHHHHGGFGYRNYGFGGISFYAGYNPYRNVSYYGGWNNYYRPAYINYGCYRPINYCYTPTFYSSCYTQPSAYYYGASYSNPYVYNNYTPVFTSSFSPAISDDLTLVAKLVAITTARPAEVRTGEPKVVFAKTSVVNNASARRSIALGDTAFREGRFSDALIRYRSAADVAPDMAETFYRKGHAYLANGQYRLATTAFQQGAKLDRSGNRDGFQLKEIYTNEAVKTTHLENLAALATMDKNNADAYYMLGVMLKYNGEAERAEKFFSQALKVGLDAEPVSPIHLADAPIRAREI